MALKYLPGVGSWMPFARRRLTPSLVGFLGLIAMKIVLVFFLFTAVCLPTPAQQKKSDRERAGLLGPVCEVAQGIFNPPTLGVLDSTRRAFNREGRLLQIDAPSWGLSSTIERLEATDDNTVLMRRSHIGVSNAEPELLASNPDRDRDGNELYTFLYGHETHYERDGDRVTLKAVSLQETMKTRDKVIWRKLYLFDPQNRLMEEMEVRTNDLIMRQTLYKYDSLSAQAPYYVEQRVDGIAKRKVWYRYENDIRGNWIKRIRIKEEPSIPSSPPTNITYRAIAYCS